MVSWSSILLDRGGSKQCYHVVVLCSIERSEQGYSAVIFSSMEEWRVGGLCHSRRMKGNVSLAI